MAAKPKTVKTFSLGPTSGWLPGVAAFLCLCMLAMAAMTLVSVNSVPKVGQKSNITGVSAQGVAGLRRLLEAQGYGIIINRMEDGPLLDHGDLEVITLDNDGGSLVYNYVLPEKGQNTSSSSTSSSTSASSVSSVANSQTAGQGASDSAQASDSAAGVSASSKSNSAQPSNAQADSDTDGDYSAQMIPNPLRANHVLKTPLGRAVLIVAPKWDAGPMPQNPLWDQAPVPVPAPVILKTLTILSPVTEQAIPEEDDAGKPKAKQVLPPLQPGTERKQNGNRWVTYDTPDYHLQRDFTVIPPKKNTDPDSNGLPSQPQYKPVASLVTLTPAPGQTLFTAPLVLGKVNSLQSISGPNLQPILLGPKGEVILSRVIVTKGRAQPKVPVYLLSDPDLLNNQIFSDPQKVVSALTLIKAVTPPTKTPKIVFNLTFNNLGFQHDLLHALSRPPYIGVPLTLLVLALGLMWAAFSRFGPAIEAPMTAPLGRGVQVLADNAARLLAMTLKETKLAPAYALLVRDLVLKNRGHIQMRANQNLDDLAEQIGRISHTTDSFLDLKEKAERIATVHQLIDITLKLHAWKTEIDHAHI